MHLDLLARDGAMMFVSYGCFPRIGDTMFGLFLLFSLERASQSGMLHYWKQFCAGGLRTCKVLCSTLHQGRHRSIKQAQAEGVSFGMVLHINPKFCYVLLERMLQIDSIMACLDMTTRRACMCNKLSSGAPGRREPLPVQDQQARQGDPRMSLVPPLFCALPC